MSNCLKCGKSFIPSKGLVNYCSTFCIHSKVQTEVINKKRSIKLKKRWNLLTDEEKKVITANKMKYNMEEAAKKLKQKWMEKLFARDWDTLCFESKRRKVIIEQQHKCNKCNLSSWFGEPLVLEIDHKNGISDNDSRDNLEAICPNCHSLTYTWRGRNRKALPKAKKVSDHDIASAFAMCNGNIRQTLLSVGLAAKGDNYNRVKKIMDKKNIK